MGFDFYKHMVSSPWSMRSCSSCVIILILISASRFSHTERKLPSHDHFCVEDKRQAESNDRLIVLKGLYFLHLLVLGRPPPSFWAVGRVPFLSSA